MINFTASIDETTINLFVVSDRYVDGIVITFYYLFIFSLLATVFRDASFPSKEGIHSLRWSIFFSLSNIFSLFVSFVAQIHTLSPFLSYWQNVDGIPEFYFTKVKNFKDFFKVQGAISRTTALILLLGLFVLNIMPFSFIYTGIKVFLFFNRNSYIYIFLGGGGWGRSKFGIFLVF